MEYFKLEKQILMSLWKNEHMGIYPEELRKIEIEIISEV